jgi:hypothetical protein
LLGKDAEDPMSCILIGMVGFGLLLVTLRPLFPAAMGLFDLAASRLGETPEPELVPIRVDRRPHR